MRYQTSCISKLRSLFVVMVLLVLAGCVGGGDDRSSSTDTAPQVAMGIYDAVAVEGSDDLEFLVVLATASTEAVTVNYSTLDGTAVAGEDYQSASGQLSFAPGETRQTVDVQVRNNNGAQLETSKTMHLQLSSPVHAVMERDTGVGSIIDKDQMSSASSFDPNWGEEGVFTNAQTCAGCHTASTAGDPDVVMRSPITDPNGDNVSPATKWGHSVMAHSLNDPYFQAAVEDEAAHFPGLAGFIEDICMTCHAPMARTHAHQTGSSLTQDASCTDPAGCFRFETAMVQNLAREGVSCTSCHQIQDDGTLGTAASFSGAFTISDNAREILGPFANPLAQAMQNQTMYTPVQGVHMQSSSLCASCHTLHTPTMDADTGQPTGERFLEQGPFLEWQNSVYSTGNAQEKQCQDCHMAEPSPGYATAITTRPATAPDRTPFAVHGFAGGNTHLLEILRDYRDVLGIAASTTVAGFDEKISETRALLENEAAGLEIAQTSVVSGTLNVDVLVTNKTGHKLPTSYPSRRAWIHLKVSQGGQVIFESGRPDSEGRISTDEGRLAADCMSSEKLEGFSNDGCLEPHRDEIHDPEQVAIYESVLGDTNNHITHTLLLAKSYLKDNRIPPAGFTSSRAYAIDSQTVPVGVGGDADFNCVGTTEGCGTDTVHYHIPVSGLNGPYTIEASLLYQSIQPGFVDGLHAHGQRVDRFKLMFDEKPPAVEVLASDTAVH